MRDPYKIVTIWHRNKGKTFKVARLVAFAFIPNPENKPEVNHLKGKLDDRVESLEWATSSENQLHAYKAGLQPSKKGEGHHLNKLLEGDVKKIRRLYKLGKFQKDIAVLFGVDQSTISYIINKKRWLHI